MITPEQRRLRAQIAARTRFHDPDDEDLAAARREFRVNRIEHRLRHELSQGPALTTEERKRLVAVLLAPEDGTAP